MAEKKNKSVEEILAAARQKDGGGGKLSGSAERPPAAAQPATDESAPNEMVPPAEEPAAVVQPPPSAKPAAKIKPGSLSVTAMLAAARAEKAGGTAAVPKSETKVPAAKAETKVVAQAASPKMPAAATEKTTEKTTAKPAAAKAPTLDTASILLAARTSGKPGPVSKAVAAAQSAPAVEKAAKKKLEVPPMPVKPSFAKPGAATAEPTRRGFFDYMASVVLGSSLAFGFASLAVTHLLWVLGFARFMFPNILTEPPSRFKVGFPDVLGGGQVDERFKAQFGVWVVKTEYEGQMQIFAIKTVCTHLGCTPNWLEAEQKFKCPCHGSGFYKDGINFEGPAPRPLERYAIRIADDGQLEVDKSRVFHEELGQWKDSASYFSA